jgi:hypothetical protein
MTRRDLLACVHEPFSDAFYFGPERLSERYENDKRAREQTGFAESTFKTIFDLLESKSSEVRPSHHVLARLPDIVGDVHTHIFLFLIPLSFLPGA